MTSNSPKIFDAEAFEQRPGAGDECADAAFRFRVGRRCRPQGVDWKELVDGFELTGRHDGYRHLPGRPTHVRTFRWQGDGRLEILDWVASDHPVRSVARLHLHPDCRIRELGAETCGLQFPGGDIRVSWSGWETVAEEESFYCPELGVEIPNPCLAFSSSTSALEGTTLIELL